MGQCVPGGRKPCKNYGVLWVSASRGAENLVKNLVSYRFVHPGGPKTQLKTWCPIGSRLSGAENLVKNLVSYGLVPLGGRNHRKKYGFPGVSAGGRKPHEKNMVSFGLVPPGGRKPI